MNSDKTFEIDFHKAGGIDAMVADLSSYRDTIKGLGEDAMEEGDDQPWGDVRLQYHDGQFSLRTGDSSYDQDHRGAWGCASVGGNMDADELRDVALALKEDCAECYAEMQA